MISLTTLTPNAMAVTGMPEDANSLSVSLNRLQYCTKDKDSDFIPQYLNLPQGSWRILGVAETVTEEAWKKVVQSLPSVFGLNSDFKDYMKPYQIGKTQYTFTSATESAHSLLQSNNVPLTALILIRE